MTKREFFGQAGPCGSRCWFLDVRGRRRHPHASRVHSGHRSQSTGASLFSVKNIVFVSLILNSMFFTLPLPSVFPKMNTASSRRRRRPRPRYLAQPRSAMEGDRPPSVIPLWVGRRSLRFLKNAHAAFRFAAFLTALIAISIWLPESDWHRHLPVVA